MYETVRKEKALLVMVETEKPRWPKEFLIDEFRNLVLSCGISVEELVYVKSRGITSALYIGKGKVEELVLMVQEKDINVVIFNNNLKFTQQRNLEDVLMVKTIDRTQLILDIFANHAQTQEGILQVELAQLQYLLPRLKGKGVMLSRLAGGIGTRGPGERKLEVDRRKIDDRIVHLKKELESIRQHRDTIRKKREKEKIYICSLVGYTNAGKSTLLNTLTESSERTAPSLFTTLDTVSRILYLHDNLKILLTDTVGFLHDLPLYLIEAFKATLEELDYAHILLHVIDASSPDIGRLISSVNVILTDLKLNEKPAILIFNKIDKTNPQDLVFLKKSHTEAVFISALKKEGIEILREKIYEKLFKSLQDVILKFPFSLMGVIDYIHKNCEVIKTNYQENNVVCRVRAKKEKLDYLKSKGVEVSEI